MDPQNDPYTPPKSTESEPLVPSTATTSDERTWGLLAHLSGPIATLLGGFGFIGPLIVWLIKREEYAFVNDQGKEALNFQLTMLIAYVVTIVATVVSCGMLFFLIFLPLILQIVLPILGAIEANKGVVYRYPLTIRMIS